MVSHPCSFSLNKQWITRFQPIAKGTHSPFQEKTENQEVLKEEREIFDLADKDKNGLLTSEEYARLSQPLDFPEMHKLIVTHALRKKDANKDGKGKIPVRGSCLFISKS